jgi:Zn-dependent protease
VEEGELVLFRELVIIHEMRYFALMTDLSSIQKIVVCILPLTFAITLHEVAHGFVAFLFGDYTAKLSGRLSLNPIKHIDPMGTIVIPILLLVTTNFVFGWAKAVPVDPRNLHHPRRDMAFVALAGPLSNLVMALLWGLITKIGLMATLSGSEWLGTPLAYMGAAGILINVVLGVLNLIPIPPLDGAKVLATVLPPRAAYYFNLLEPYGFFILIILMLTNVLFYMIIPFASFLIEKISIVLGIPPTFIYSLFA